MLVMFVILFTQQEPVYPEMLQLQKKEKKKGKECWNLLKQRV